MPKVLEINTSETLFEDPITVVIDGKEFAVKEVTLGVLEKIQNLYQEALAGSAKSIRQMIELILGDDPVFLKMTMRQLKTLVSVIVEKSLNPPEDAEKNASSPGDVISP